MQFRARFIAQIIQFAARQGAGRKSLLALTDTSMEELNTDDVFFPAGIYNAVIEEAVRQTGDDHIGLHLGDYLSLSAAGLIVQIVQSSPTVHAALQYLIEFANLGCQAMPFALEERTDEWELSLVPHPLWLEQSPVAVRHTMDGNMLFTLREFHTLTRRRYRPRRMHFAYDRPEGFREYEELFGCPVHFGKDRTAMFLEKDQVAESVVTSDYRLLQILVQYAEEKLKSVQGDEADFAQQVRQSVINLIKPEFPTIERVAASLNLSVRSLQRKLKEEGYTYQQLMDELRRQFAEDYLRNKELNVKEIAYLLDYAEPSSFVRAFKRWHAMSPTEWRSRF